MTSHDLSVPDECQWRQTLDKCVSHHLVCAQRHELKKPCQDEFAHKVMVDVNVTRQFLAHRILAYSNSGKIVFVEKIGLRSCSRAQYRSSTPVHHQNLVSDKVVMYYSQSHLGWHFQFLIQSSKLKARKSFFTETWKKRRSSFELWASENVTAGGIGCNTQKLVSKSRTRKECVDSSFDCLYIQDWHHVCKCVE